MGKKRTHAAQCAECRAEEAAESLPSSSNAISLTEVRSFVTSGPKTKTVATVDHVEITDEKSSKHGSDEDAFVVVAKLGLE